MIYASERGFKVGNEYVIARGAFKGCKVLFVKDYGTTYPGFLDVENGEYLFIGLDDFDYIKYNEGVVNKPTPKQILLKYIDEKYYDDGFLKYLISLV